MFIAEASILEVPDFRIENSSLHFANYPEVQLEFVEDGDGGVLLSYGFKVYDLRDEEDDLVASLMLSQYGQVFVYAEDVPAIEEFFMALETEMGEE